jgi:MoxR-like ATPase
MSILKHKDRYEGHGQSGKNIMHTIALADTMDPQNYIAGPRLQKAVNVALALGQPLLVTGDPGTGKTQLAASIAYEYDLPLLSFHVKSTSVAQDLFYQYDALRRFQDSYDSKKEINAINYITFKALGLAILLSLPKEEADPFLPESYKGKGPTRSVILLDEIDKAPRDLPNDVLLEIEHLKFDIKEIEKPSDTQNIKNPPFKADENYRPIVVITSNSEKNLPDAFLRRCVFYHIPFPDDDALETIIKRRFASDPHISQKLSENYIKPAIDHFKKIQKLPLKRKPSPAELLAWFNILYALDLVVRNLTADIKDSYTVLAKNHDDLASMEQFLMREIP